MYDTEGLLVDVVVVVAFLYLISQQSITDDVIHITQDSAAKNMSARAAEQTEPRQSRSLDTKADRAMNPER